MTLSHVIVVIVLLKYLTDCSIRVCCVCIFERGIERDTVAGAHNALHELSHVQMQNNALYV